ncbi:hypothetical protein L228DRAFT_247589 [Xylona heveae TC161]|uniref:Uncharacterized protein n=1 Tax=Xylona heveae (strain CBS 132557 / TC161) TaxID=1328760 RepID=A0A165GB60_XYLHT|nr:hypothetical protein L228DRAFT_247589 [Xylona heveae TC161]KZF21977.1 hypothetical protein L228DRAFT_247589 [Xylona heveae TC161]
MRSDLLSSSSQLSIHIAIDASAIMAEQTPITLTIRGAESSEQSTSQLFSSSSMSMGEKMRKTIELYREKMYTSNKKFIYDRIEDIEAMNLPSEEEKLVVMGRFWFLLNEWHRREGWNPPWMASNAKKDIASKTQLESERAVKRLEDVKTLPHPVMDGLHPPELDETQRQLYIETFETVTNELAKTKDEAQWIRMPEELKSFLKYANGLEGPNFRYGKAYDFHMYGSGGLENKSIEETRDIFLDLHKHSHECLQEFFELEFEAKAAYICGETFWLDCCYYTFYAYCRLDAGFAKRHKRGHDWAWRIVLTNTSCDEEDLETKVFDSLEEFIIWHGSWDERMDVEEMREQMFENSMGIFQLESGYPDLD